VLRDDEIKQAPLNRRFSIFRFRRFYFIFCYSAPRRTRPSFPARIRPRDPVDPLPGGCTGRPHLQPPISPLPPSREPIAPPKTLLGLTGHAIERSAFDLTGHASIG